MIIQFDFIFPPCVRDGKIREASRWRQILVADGGAIAPGDVQTAQVEFAGNQIASRAMMYLRPGFFQ
jgi:hypothetical protein